jgi:hypothetical protein
MCSLIILARPNNRFRLDTEQVDRTTCTVGLFSHEKSWCSTLCASGTFGSVMLRAREATKCVGGVLVSE